MICSCCGRHDVLWIGDLLNSPQTECLDCGAINCQEPPLDEGDTFEDLDSMKNEDN